MGNKLKGGLLLGGLLAAGAAIGFAMSKEGGKLTKALQKDLKVLTKNLKKNLDELQDVTKENFDEVVKRVVDENADKMKLANAAKKKLVAALQDLWQEFEEDMEEETPAVKRAAKKLKT